MYRKLLNHALIVSLVWATTPIAFAGDVVVDNFTVGDLTDDTTLALTDVGSGTADTFNIVEALGQRANNNLFHSFLSFNVDPAEVALFSGDPAITNVISRVSGGGQSLIDGTIRNDIAGANFWFVNTAGVMIGANAAFDVSGALSIGAVDYVLLEDGMRFYALEEPGENISALTFNPVDFGFLPGSSAGDLTITGLTLDDTATGSLVGDITLAGGSVSITDSTIINKPEASGSAITITGPAVTLNNTTIQNQANTLDADDINVTATAGDVFIRNGAIIRSNPSTVITDAGATGSILITASDDVRVNIDDAGVATGEAGVQVSSSPFGASSGAGDIAIQGTNVLASGLQISSNNNSNAVAAGQGTVTVHAAGVDDVAGFIGGEMSLTNGTINADAGGGPASDIFLTTGQDTGGTVQGSVILTNTTVLAASGSSNPAGTFAVTTDTFEMTGGAAVAEAFADGDAGVIDIDAARSLTLNNTFLYTPALSTAAVGSGSITLSSTGVDVDNQGVVNINNTRIGTETRGASAAGNVIVSGGAINITGTSGGRGIEANSVTGATGAAGSISFVGDSLTLTDAKINTSTVSNTLTPGAGDINADISGAIDATNSAIESSTAGNADAGNITLNSSSFAMQGGEIAARNTGAGTGAAGDITLNDNTSAVLDTVTITGGGDLRADAGSDGSAAGEIQINATGLVSVSGDGGPVTDPGDPTVIDPDLFDAAVSEITSSAGEGSAGAVTIAGSSVNLTNTAVTTETASTSVNVPASINISADAASGAVTLENSSVLASTAGIADAGDISLSGATISITGLGTEFDPVTGDPVTDPNGIEATSTDTGANGGAAGNISLTANSLVIADSKLTSSTASGDGTKTPGSIDINVTAGTSPADGTVTLVDTAIEASASGAADAGSVFIAGVSTALVSGTNVTTTSTGTGAAGSISVAGDTDVNLNNARLTSSANNAAARGSGNVAITAGVDDVGGIVVGDITMTNATIETRTISDLPTPVAGSVDVAANGSIIVANSQLDSISDGQADAGTVSVHGLNGAGAGSISFTSASVTADALGGGNAAAVTILAEGDVTASGGQFLSRAVNFSCATPPCPGVQGGSITFAGANIDLQDGTIDTLSLDNAAGNVNFRSAGSIELSAMVLRADAFGAGTAGNVFIEGANPGEAATSVTIDQNSRITSTANTYINNFAGDAGNISINADSIVLDSATLTSAQTGTDPGSGKAGVLTFQGNSLSVTNSNLSTTTTSNSVIDPGIITASITSTGAPGSGGIVITNSVLEASASGAMDAGDILLAAETITLDGTGTRLESSATGAGATGNITLQGTGTDGAGLQTVSITNGADLRADTTNGLASANIGGVIEINAEGAVTISGVAGGDRAEISSTSGADAGTNAGQILIAGSGISMSDALLSSSATGNGAVTGQGNAGNVTIIDGASTSITDSTIESQSSGVLAGLAGSIDLSGTTLTTDGAVFSAATASDIDISATPDLAASIDLSYTGAVTLTNTDAATSTSGATDAGDITVSGAALEISGVGTGGGIAATSTATGAAGGAAGSITLTGDSLLLNNAGLASTTSSSNAANAASSILADIDGSVTVTGTTVVTASTSGTVVAGDITFDGSSVSVTGVDRNTASFIASSSSTGAAGTISITGDTLDFTDTRISTTTTSNNNVVGAGAISLESKDTTAGTVTLTNTDVLASSSNIAAAGSIDVTGVDALLDTDTRLQAIATAGGAAGDITIAATGDVQLNTATVQSRSTSGSAGQITIAGIGTDGTDSVTITAGSLLDSSATDGGAAGDVVISTDGVLQIVDSTIRSSVDSQAGFQAFIDCFFASTCTARGNSGKIALQGQQVNAADTTIEATGAFSTGGDILIQASDQISLTDNSELLATSRGGDAGNVLLTGIDSDTPPTTIVIDSSDVVTTTQSQLIPSPFFFFPDATFAGDAGNVTINGGAISVLNSSNIRSDQQAFDGDGGATTNSGTVSFTGESLTLADSTITARTAANASAISGDISVDVSGDITMGNSFIISSTTGNAAAGDITLNGSNFDMDGGEIRATSDGRTGAAGNIVFNDGLGAELDTFTVSSGGDILADAGTLGTSAGLIAINATGDVSVSGSTSAPAGTDAALAEINSSAIAGPAGDVSIDGAEIELSNARLATETSGSSGSPAAITIGTDDTGTIAITDSALVASAQGAINAGDISIGTDAGAADITISGALAAPEGIESSTSGTGDAGLITITGTNVALNDGARVIATASAGATGVAGDINITGTSSVTSNSEFVNGTWTVDPDLQDAASQVVIASSAESLDSAGAGTVTITAGESGFLAIGELFLANSSVQSTTISNVIPLAPGEVIMTARADLTLTGTDVAVSAQGAMNAGDITINANNVAFLDGTRILATASTGIADDPDTLEDESVADPDGAIDGSIGTAGSITISATTSVSSNAQLVAGTWQTDQALTADTARVQISSSADNEDSRGSGFVDISSGGNMFLANAAVESKTASNVRIKLNPDGTPELDADGNTTSLTPGFIDIQAGGDLSLTNVAVEGSTRGAFDAGDITLSGINIALNDATAVLAGATSSRGDDPTTPFTIETFEDPDFTTAGSVGQAGSITITGVDTVATNSFFDTNTSAWEADPTLAADSSLVTIASSANNRDSRGAGDVTVDANELLLSNTRVESRTLSNVVAVLDDNGDPVLDVNGDPVPVLATAIDLSVPDNVRIFDSGVVTSAFGQADAGSIDISGNEVHIAGAIDILGLDEKPLQDFDDDTGQPLFDANGDPIFQQASVIARSQSGGAAGNVTITSTESGSPGVADLTVANTALLSDATGGGASGSIVLTGEDISVANAEFDVRAFSFNFAGDDVGGGGLIMAAADNNLDISDSNMTAFSLALTSVDGGRVDLSAGNVLYVENSEATNVVLLNANGGDLTLTAPTVQLVNSTFNSSTIGQGSAGSVQVTSNDFSMSGGDLTSSSAFIEGTTDLLAGIFGLPPEVGDAGTIVIQGPADNSGLNSVAITEGAVISTSATARTGGANAGTIDILADGPVTISGTGFAGVDLAPAAGDIDALNLLVDPTTAGIVSSASNLEGSAGAITITGSSISLANAAIRTETASTVDGGNPAAILLSATGEVTMVDSAVLASTSGAADAGNIDIVGGGNISVSGLALLPDRDGNGELILDGNGLPTLNNFGIVVATSAGGNAGDINIDGDQVAFADGARVLATAATGDLDDPATLEDESVADPDDSAAGSVGAAGSITVVGATSVSMNSRLNGTTGVWETVAGETVTISSSANNEDSRGSGSVELSSAGDVVLANATVESTTASNVRISLNRDGSPILDAGNTTSLTPGFIDLDAGANLSLTNVAVEGSTRGAFDAGDITLSGINVALNDGTAIRASATSSRADDLTTEFTIETFEDPDFAAAGSVGQAGSITITGVDSVTTNSLFDTATGTWQADANLGTETSLVAIASSANNRDSRGAGDISVTANELLLSNTRVESRTLSDVVSVLDDNGDPVLDSNGEPLPVLATAVELTAPGNVRIFDSGVVTSTFGRAAAGGIDISGREVHIAGAIDILGRDSKPIQDFDENGQPLFDANGDPINQQASVIGRSQSSGAAGNVSIASTETGSLGEVDLQIDDTSILSDATGGGLAGVIQLAGEDIAIDNAELNVRAFNFTSRTADGTNGGGLIVADAANNLTITNATLDALTIALADVTGGEFDLRAGNVLRIEDSDVGNQVLVRANAGDISLTAPTVELVRSDFNSSTIGDGSAGSINIATNNFSQTGGVVTSSAAFIEPTSRQLHQAFGLGDVMIGDAGTITIGGHANGLGLQSVALSEGAIIATNSSEGTQASNAGTIDILADGEVTIAGNGLDGVDLAAAAGDLDALNALIDPSTSAIISNASNLQGSAGAITITGSSITMQNAAIRTETGSTIPGGTPATIRLEAQGDIDLDNSAVLASTSGAGNAGNIDLIGDNITVDGLLALPTRDGSAVLVLDSNGLPTFNSFGIEAVSSDTGIDAGAAGTITLQGNSLALTDTNISTATFSNNPNLSTPGSILADMADSILVTGSTTVQASTRGAADAGSVTLIASSIDLLGVDDNGDPLLDDAGNPVSPSVQATANTQNSGAAGTVRLEADTLTLANATVSTVTAANDPNNDRGSIEAFVTGLISVDDARITASTSGGSDAGDVTLNGGSILVTNNGIVGAATVDNGNAGDVSLVAANTIELSNASSVGASSGPNDANPTASNGIGNAGAVFIDAGADLTITDSTVGSRSSVQPNNPNEVGTAGIVDIQAANIVATNSTITTQTESNITGGAGGSVTMESDGNLFLDGTRVTASTTGDANAGSISLIAADIDLANQSAVLASSSGGGNAGNVSLQADNTINLPDGMLVAARSNGSGNAGSVSLDAGGLVSITGATVESSSLRDDPGEPIGLAGFVNINGGDVVVTNGLISTRTDSDIPEDQVDTPDGQSEPGAIALVSASGVLLDASTIETVTSGGADAGDITVEAKGADIDLTNQSTVTASTSGSGDAGDVALIAAGAINLPIDTEVSAKSTGAGDAGSVNLDAGATLTIDSALVTSSSDGVGVGTAGNVDLSGSDITITNALVSTQSSSDLDTSAPDDGVRPGTITVTTPGLVLLEQGSRLSASVSGASDGGAILITANDLTMVDGSVVETRATGTGNSGSVTLDIANDVRLVTPAEATLPDDQTAILTNSQKSQGGTITADIRGVLFQDRGRIESSVETADGKGGDIVLTANGLFMVGSQILARADQGNGGAIFINRGVRTPDPATDTPFDGLFIIDSESLINADSAAGVSGEVNIDSPDADLTAVVEVVDARIVEDPTLADDVCNPSTREAQSSFIVEDQGGVAPSPDGYFSAGVLSADETSQIARGAPTTADDAPQLLAVAGGCN